MPTNSNKPKSKWNGTNDKRPLKCSGWVASSISSKSHVYWNGQAGLAKGMLLHKWPSMGILFVPMGLRQRPQGKWTDHARGTKLQPMPLGPYGVEALFSCPETWGHAKDSVFVAGEATTTFLHWEASSILAWDTPLLPQAAPVGAPVTPRNQAPK